RALRKSRELRIVAIEHGGAAGFDSEKNFSLGVGNPLDRAEEFEMHRLDRRDDRNMRTYHPGQRLDLASMVHAHFEHRKSRRGWTARERQRPAPMIVVGSNRGMGLATCRKRKTQGLLGAGLADRSGDADDFASQADARSAGERAQPFEHIRHGE